MKSILKNNGNKKLSHSLILRILLASAQVMLLLSACSQASGNGDGASSGSGEAARTDAQKITYYSSATADDNILFWSYYTEPIKIETDTTNMSSDANIDHSAYTMLTGTERSLYLMRNGSLQRIDEDVSNVFLSVFGDSVAYTDGDAAYGGKWRSEGGMKLYVVNGTAGEVISEKSTGDAKWSPDGTKILFSEQDGNKFALKLYDGKSTIQIAESDANELRPLGVSNDAKYIWYWSKGNNQVCCTDGETVKVIGTFELGYGSYLFNKDHSQISFHTDSGCYICLDGENSIKVEGRFFSPLLPSGTRYCIQDVLHEQLITYETDSFQDSLFLSDNTVYRFGEEFAQEPVLNKVVTASIANDGHTFFYKAVEGGFFRTDLNNLEAEPFLITDETDIKIEKLSADGNVYCFVRGDGALFYREGEQDIVRIDSGQGIDQNESGYYNSCFSYSDASNTIYFIEGGVLYASKDGKEKTAIEGEGIKGKISGVVARDGGISVYVREGDTGANYLSTDGKTFKLIVDGLKVFSY